MTSCFSFTTGKRRIWWVFISSSVGNIVLLGAANWVSCHTSIDPAGCGILAGGDHVHAKIPIGYDAYQYGSERVLDDWYHSSIGLLHK